MFFSSIRQHVVFYISNIVLNTRPSNYVLERPGFACNIVLFYCIFLFNTIYCVFTMHAMSWLKSNKNSPFLEGLNIWLVSSALITTNPVIIELSYVSSEHCVETKCSRCPWGDIIQCHIPQGHLSELSLDFSDWASSSALCSIFRS